VSRHFRTLCHKCKKVIAQCRCMDCDEKVQNYALCNECIAKKKAKMEAKDNEL